AVHQALERLPADRQASAAEFAAALSADAKPRLVAHRPPPMRLTAMVAAGLAAGLLLGWVAAKAASPSVTLESRRWNIILPDSAPVALAGPGTGSGWQTAIALSPA